MTLDTASVPPRARVSQSETAEGNAPIGPSFPVDEERRYDRRSYYDRPYRSSSYYGTPRYVDDSYAPRRYDNYSVYSGYAASCYTRRIQVEDGRGGWVWGVKRVCD